MIDLPYYGEIAAGVMSIAALIGAIWKFGMPAWRRTRSALSGLLDIGRGSAELLGLADRVGTLEARVQKVVHEVTPNGGSSFRDIGSRTEAALNLLIGQMRAHADADDDVVRLDCNARGEVEWMARALSTWTERTFEELRGFGWMSFIAPDEREDVAAEFERCIRHRRHFDSAFRMIDRSGDMTLVRAAFAPVVTRKVGDTETLRWVGTMRRLSAPAPDALAAPERAPQSRAP